MVISDLISILNAIRNECGDIAIELYIDKRQYENPYSGMKESAIITEVNIKVVNAMFCMILSRRFIGGN